MHLAHREHATRVLYVRELVRHVALCLSLEQRPHVCPDTTVDTLNLRDEAFVHSEDMVCVVASKAHELEDVRNSHRRYGRVEAEDELTVLGLQQDTLFS